MIVNLIQRLNLQTTQKIKNLLKTHNHYLLQKVIYHISINKLSHLKPSPLSAAARKFQKDIILTSG